MHRRTVHGQPALEFRDQAELDAWIARVDRAARKAADERRARIRAGNPRPEDLDPFHGLC